MLAQPDLPLQRHSQTLTRQIHQTIDEQGGWIGFDRFMQLALYQPGLGYYAAGSEKFGPDGDFITAPMLGDLFAECLAGQCAEVLAIEGCNTIIEFGAGGGDLAANIIRSLCHRGAPPDRYLIVETSADLASRQRQRIDRLAVEFGEEICEKVQWLDHLPEQIHGIVIGNELIDALPCKRFELNNGRNPVELGVAAAGDSFCWRLGEPLAMDVNLGQCSAGYQSEWSPQAQAWVKSVADNLSKGMILLIDYGFPEQEFYHPDRRQGTLMCHYRHHAHGDPFFWPGLQDITCHVDFSAIARAGIEAGMSLLGYCSQGEFLLAAGLLDHLQVRLTALEQADANAATKEQLSLAAEVKKLTLPHEMGELFKVIALSSNIDCPLSGFSRANKRNRLIQ